MKRSVVMLLLLGACGESADPQWDGATSGPLGSHEAGATVDAAGAVTPGTAGTQGGGQTGAGPGAPGGGSSDASVLADASGGGQTGGGQTGGGRDASVGADAGSGSDSGTSSDGGSAQNLPKFSFFVTSLASLRELSKSQSGFGGDLRFGETGDGAGLRGADKICATIAEKSMPGSSAKQWRAFLSTSKVHAKDRIGTGPWHDRQGRILAMNLTALLKERPEGAHAQIINDFPNEFGVPNHNPDGTGNVDNHDMLTGSNAMGMLYTTSDGSNHNCNDWTSAAGDSANRPRVGHSWPRSGGGGGGFPGGGGFQGGGFQGGGAAGGGMAGLGTEDGSMNNWMSALNEAGCAPGVSLIEMGPPILSMPTVGSGGGYGGFYCFALTP
jgi:hypothetical protein